MPITARVSIESTLSYCAEPGSVAPTPYALHSSAIPSSRMASIAMMIVSVILAFFRVSSRNAITPLLTASTPVIAVQPEEKTFSISHRLIASVAAGIAGSGVTG